MTGTPSEVIGLCHHFILLEWGQMESVCLLLKSELLFT